MTVDWQSPSLHGAVLAPTPRRAFESTYDATTAPTAVRCSKPVMSADNVRSKILKVLQPGDCIRVSALFVGHAGNRARALEVARNTPGLSVSIRPGRCGPPAAWIERAA